MIYLLIWWTTITPSVDSANTMQYASAETCMQAARIFEENNKNLQAACVKILLVNK